MNIAMRFMLGVFGLFAIVVIMLGMMGIGTYNGVVRMEKRIVAQYEQNQNNLSTYSNKIMEAVQVPSMYRDDFSKVLKDTMQGRYGEGGSKAAFQWIKENNINFDSSMYTKIQTMVEAGRNAFEFEQKKLIDLKRQYTTSLDTFPSGFVARMLGFPKINLDEYKIVKSGYSNKAFNSGQEDGLKFR